MQAFREWGCREWPTRAMVLGLLLMAVVESSYFDGSLTWGHWFFCGAVGARVVVAEIKKEKNLWWVGYTAICVVYVLTCEWLRRA